MNGPWIAAGGLALLGTVIHALGGERIVFSDTHPRAIAGAGSSTARSLARTTWHLTTAAFAVLGTAALVCGFIGVTAATKGAARVVAAGFSAFAVMVIVSALAGGGRGLLRHPAPLMLTVTATLTWWGVIR